MSDRDNGAVVGALMLVAGGIIGAGVALLFAPQSGRKTRKDITRYAKKARCKVEGVAEEFSESISNMVDTVEEKASELMEKGKDFAHDAKKDIMKAIEEGQEQLERQKKRLTKLVG